MLSFKKQSGVGLIEVLIATVVIALGLMAVASMQGNFLASSGDSKARSEALVLAEKELESIRNMIEVDDYDVLTDPLVIPTLTTTNFDGTNATFTIVRSVGAELSAPTRKPITVTVSWAGGEIELEHELVFSDPKNSVALAAYGSSDEAYGKAPGPEQKSNYASPNKKVNLDINSDINPAGTHTLLADNVYQDTDSQLWIDNNDGTATAGDLCSNLQVFDPDLRNADNYPSQGQNNFYSIPNQSAPELFLYTKRVSEDGVVGNEVVELYTVNYTQTIAQNGAQSVVYHTVSNAFTCKWVNSFIGGVLIPIKGILRTTLTNIDDVNITFDQSDKTCVYNAGVGEKARPYACYIGGNCSEGPNGDSDTNAKTCTTQSAHNAIVGPGGFSGNVGLTNQSDKAKYNVCFGDELLGTNIIRKTARKYRTVNASVTPTEQGINQAQDCQDFLIVGSQANVARLAAKCSAEAQDLAGQNLDASVPFHFLAPQTVTRNINGSNVVASTTESTYCTQSVTPTSYTFSGTVSANSTITAINVDSGSCSFTATTFSCDISTVGLFASVLIAGVHNNGDVLTGSCVFNLTSPLECKDGGTVITLSTPTIYTVTGTYIEANNQQFSLVISDKSPLSTPVPCTSATATVIDGNDVFPFTCVISTNESAVYLDANQGKKNSDSCSYIGLDPSNTTLPLIDATTGNAINPCDLVL